MSYKPADFDRMWDKFKFTVRSGDHVRADLYVDDRLVVRTRRSHGSGKLDGQIPSKIRQQMHLNEAEFQRAIECPMSRQEYLQLLGRKGKLGTAD